MKNIKKYFFFLLIFTVFIVPVATFAQTRTEPINKEILPDGTKVRDIGLIQCGRDIFTMDFPNDQATGRNITKGEVVPCNFDDLIFLIDRIIKFILGLAVAIIAIMFVYAGFLLITSAGDTSARTKAKEIFMDALIGLVIAFAAFLIIKLLFSVLGYAGGSLFGF